MNNNMCLYTISEAPYLALSNVFKEKKNRCIVKDTRGRLKKVDPIYIGPFDLNKFCMFGALICKYFQKDATLDENSLRDKTFDLFGIVSST